MKASVNIVSFDVPFPPNYGGVIDVYYKLFWLKKLGVKVYLHCFAYGRQEADELEEFCEEVYYYPRNTGWLSNFSLFPYTVKSRQSLALENNLLKNDYPILFEVLHTCYLLNDPRFKKRLKIYRHSNIEHHYYSELSKVERNKLKQIYLLIESYRLKRFESVLAHANTIAAVNESDVEYFKRRFPQTKTFYLPSFHEHGNCKSILGKGNYVFFHGNLSIAENYDSLIWLVEHVFSKLKHQIIVAGLNPPEFLVKLISNFENIQLVNSPSHIDMNVLLEHAQVQVLFTKQSTGLKLKLLNALFSGRFIVCNSHMLSGTLVTSNSSLHICNTANDFIAQINSLMSMEFDQTNLDDRKKLTEHFDNLSNAKKLIDLISEA